MQWATTQFLSGQEKIGAGPVTLILHGLFGSGRNWRSLADRLAKNIPGSVLWTADLPNHGETYGSLQDGQPVPMGWSAMAEGLEGLLETTAKTVGVDRLTLIGHSLGGQVAMQSAFLAKPNFRRFVSKLVVVDVAPRPVSFRGSAMERLLRQMITIEEDRVTSRESAANMLRVVDEDEMVVQFLLSNGRVDPETKTFRFKLPLTALLTGMHRLQDTYMNVPRSQPIELPTLFIKGEHSNFIQPSDEGTILRLLPNSVMRTIQGAGHWPHHQNPVGFIEAIQPFLQNS